ncbi:hypothetical protein DL98DRAFT_659454 [Cadophora sp. DSE1049]|nr:hypothetical protein DL98DRAFT_659454 [Cadophora sp. DSE1049]
MPAPHDQRFCIIFKFAQQNNRYTDQELLDLFDSALEQVLKDEPNLAEDETIPKAMRTWCRTVIPEEGTPEFLCENVRLKRLPRFGDAVVIPSHAKGTFWWNRKTKKVQWVWWDPDTSRAGQILHTEPPSAAGHQSEGQGSKARHPSPSIAVKTEPRDNADRMENAVFSGIGQTGADGHRLGFALPDSAEPNYHVRKETENLPASRGSPTSERSHFRPNVLHHRSSSYLLTTPCQRGSHSCLLNAKNIYDDEDIEDMADNAPSAPHEEQDTDARTSYAVQPPSRSATPGIVDPADTSVVLTDSYNQYYSIESFVTEKALKDGWSRGYCDLGWQRCLTHAQGEFGEKGRAYVQYKAELNYWCNMFPNEIFPGRDPRTGYIEMLTGREMSGRQNNQEEDSASDLSRTRSPSSEPPRQRARTSTMTNVHANGNRANGNGTNGDHTNGHH